MLLYSSRADKRHSRSLRIPSEALHYHDHECETKNRKHWMQSTMNARWIIFIWFVQFSVHRERIYFCSCFVVFILHLDFWGRDNNKKKKKQLLSRLNCLSDLEISLFAPVTMPKNAIVHFEISAPLRFELITKKKTNKKNQRIYCDLILFFFILIILHNIAIVFCQLLLLHSESFQNRYIIDICHCTFF